MYIEDQIIESIIVELEITLKIIRKVERNCVGERFLSLEQTITYLHRWWSSELQLFILVFQKKKKNPGGFLWIIIDGRCKIITQSADRGSFRVDLQCTNQHFSSAGAQKQL